MTSLKDLIEHSANLSNLLKAKTPPIIPQNVLSDSAITLERLLKTLRAYFPPDAAEKRAARAHPISSQIVAFTGAKERKGFFTAEYFEKKLAALPKDKKVIVASQKNDSKELLDAILVYHFRTGGNDDFKGLKAFRTAIEQDYKNQSSVQKAGEAEDLLIDLMRMDHVSKITAILKKKFPEKASLEFFAKQNSLKIPPQRRGKQTAKKTPYESLAEIIYAAGATARL
ncbi:MAG: hypothetical protein ACLQPD_33065 [Desulfomonilaceae bacterium]